MRVQSTAEVNTRQQQNPFLTRNVGHNAADKSASLVSFEECLKTQIKDAAAPAMTRKAELTATGSIWGYYMTQGASAKPEIRLKGRAYAYLPDL